MTWTRLGDTFCDRTDITSLPDGAFRLHVEALVFCNRGLLDGHLPASALARLGGRAKRASVAQLVAVGLWVEEDGGWVVDWTEQLTKAKVTEKREKDNARQERHRVRTDRHNDGDHSLCTPSCWVLQRQAAEAAESRQAVTQSVTRDLPRDATHDSTRESRRSRPEPEPEPEPEGLEGEGEEGVNPRTDAGASSGATPEDDEPADPFVKVGDCSHMAGGRDTGRFTGKMRCKKCQTLAEAEETARGRATARAELQERKDAEKRWASEPETHAEPMALIQNVLARHPTGTLSATEVALATGLEVVLCRSYMDRLRTGQVPLDESGPEAS